MRARSAATGAGLALALMVLTGAAPAAAAAPELRLLQLSADQIGSRLVVRYAFTQRQLRHGMGPLMIYVTAQPRRRPSSPTELQQAVSSPRGTLRFRLAEGVGRVRVTVWFTRTGARNEPLPLWVGPVHAKRIELAVTWTPERPTPGAAVPVGPMPGATPAAPPPGRPNWAGRRAVVAACRAAFDGPANENACIEAAARAFVNPLGMIKACERVMDGDANELRCLQTAARAAYEPSKAIAACDVCMDGDTRELACIEAAVAAPQDPSAIIERCDKSADGDRAELECIRRGTRGEPASPRR